MSYLKTFQRKIKHMCEITRSLKAILNPDSPEDKKLLLLAQLIESMKTGIEVRESAMQKDIADLREKVDSIATIKEVCPMMQPSSRGSFSRFFIEYPRVCLLIVLLAGLLLGIISPDILGVITSLIKVL